jgi:hemolysin activation/secretion protein
LRLKSRPTVCALSLSVLASMPAAAQSLPPALVAPEGLKRQEQRQSAAASLLPQGADQLRPGGGSVPSLGMLPRETPCFTIHDIRFSGAHARRLSWLSRDVAPVLGQCVGVHGLARIAEVLDAHLIELGYATSRASFPAQNLASGVLDVHLDVGLVAAVRMVRAGSGKPDTAWGTWRNAFPTGPGDILNIRDIEQGIEQMDRLPSQAVHTELVPGPAPDTSVVVIQRRSSDLAGRIHGGLTLDNSGSRLLGRPELSGAISLDNPLGLNDIVSVTANSNVENPSSSHRSQSAALSYSVPWGDNLFTLSAASLRFAQVVQGTTVQFLSSGQAQTQQLRWDHMAWRTASSKFGVFGALLGRQSRSYLDDVELIVQRRNTVNLDAGVTFAMVLPAGGRFAGQIDYRRGLADFGAQSDLPTAANGGLTVRPRIWSLAATWSQPFRIRQTPWQYTLSLRGQSTPDTLVTEDQFSIGDRTTVRGFDGNAVLAAENGYVVRNDLSRPLALVPGWAMAAYLGLDVGRVWGPSAVNLAGTRLAGTALGIKAQRGHLQLDFALATPLEHPSGFQSQHLNLYAAATVAF